MWILQTDLHYVIIRRCFIMTQEVELHFEYENMQKGPASLLRHELEARRKILLEKIEAIQTSDFDLEEHEWLARSYPVLSILAGNVDQ